MNNKDRFELLEDAIAEFIHQFPKKPSEITLREFIDWHIGEMNG